MSKSGVIGISVATALGIAVGIWLFSGYRRVTGTAWYTVKEGDLYPNSAEAGLSKLTPIWSVNLPALLSREIRADDQVGVYYVSNPLLVYVVHDVSPKFVRYIPRVYYTVYVVKRNNATIYTCTEGATRFYVWLIVLSVSPIVIWLIAYAIISLVRGRNRAAASVG